MSNDPMFDLEDCEDVDLIVNTTTSTKMLKGKKISRLHAEGNKAGLSTLNQLGFPVEHLSDEQIQIIIQKTLESEGKEISSTELQEWFDNVTAFATLANDVKSTIIGAILATGVAGYKKIRSLF